MTEFVSENERLARLKEIQPAFQSENEEPFDSIVKLVRSIFHVPIVLVSLVYDEFQWFKAGVGLNVNQTPRCQSFCAHTFTPAQPEVLCVENALEDPRFNTNPLVLGSPNIRFYCGVPLVTQDHVRLGAFCMIDDQPRHIDKKGMQMLITVAELTIRELLKSEVGKNTYKQRLLGQLPIRKLPSLARVRAIREDWFAHALDEGVLIVDAGTCNWNVLWATPTWTQITETIPLEQQGLWRLISPVNGDSEVQTHKKVLDLLQSEGTTKTSITAKVLKDAMVGYTPGGPQPSSIFLSCRLYFIHDIVSQANRIIHIPSVHHGSGPAIPIDIRDGPLLVLRATSIPEPKDKKEEPTAGDRDGDLARIVEQIRRLDANQTGYIQRDVLLELMDRMKPSDCEHDSEPIIDMSGLLTDDGRIPYVEFFRWLLSSL